MVIHLNRTIDIKDGIGRPIVSSLTVKGAAEFLRSSDLPAFVEARWYVTECAPVSIDRQIATHVRRLQKVGLLCGRVVTRVERVYGMSCMYQALLAK